MQKFFFFKAFPYYKKFIRGLLVKIWLWRFNCTGGWSFLWNKHNSVFHLFTFIPESLSYFVICSNFHCLLLSKTSLFYSILEHNHHLWIVLVSAGLVEMTQTVHTAQAPKCNLEPFTHHSFEQKSFCRIHLQKTTCETTITYSNKSSGKPMIFNLSSNNFT